MTRIARALAVVGASAVACGGNPKVSLRLSLPADIVDQAAWFEVGAFENATCAAISPMLGNGVPEGSTARVAFRREDAVGPKMGDIPNGRYAFGAVARDEECTILAAGCVERDVGDTDQVEVALSAVAEKSGTCKNGATCQAATCIPANDNANPSVGAGCSLELLGAGPLVAAIGGEGTSMSAPSIASTSTGFIVAYREVDPSGSSARLVLLPIDFGGGALRAETPGLPNRCESSIETDGIGLVVRADEGRVVLARPPCGATPALELLNFGTTSAADPGRPTLGKFLVSSSPNETPVALGPARSAAARPSGEVVVFTEGGVARIANIDAEQGIVGPNGTFGGTSGITHAWVAANDKILALLAAGGPQALSGSPDAGSDGGTEPVSGEEALLRLLVVPSTTAANEIDAQRSLPRAPIVFPGTWGSLAAFGGRAIVLSDGSGPGTSVVYRAFDLDKDTPADTNGFSVEGTGTVTAGDVAVVENHAFFVALKQNEIALHAYDNASTTLTPLRSVAFATEPRISAINTVRDGRVAIAASESRVAVAWTTAKVLGKYDRPGGYAVFACTR